MRAKREVIRETSYKSKDLVIGYQILMLRSQNETQKLFLSPSNPRVKIEARNKDNGRRSSLELQLADNMALELHQEGKLGIPALVNGKVLANANTLEVGHGSVIQIGGEIIKVKKIETHLGAKGPATQRVYASERRLRRRPKGLNPRTVQGLWALGIAISAVFFIVFNK